MNILLDMHMHLMHILRMKLNTYLETNKITDAAFGALVGLSQSQVSRIKRGLSRPSWEAMAAIEQATERDVTASDFLPSREPEAVA